MPDTDTRASSEAATDWAAQLKSKLEAEAATGAEEQAAGRSTAAPQDDIDLLLREKLDQLERDRKGTREETEATPPPEPESEPDPDPVPVSRPRPASDDELNGVTVAELLDSGAFFRGLDPETGRLVRDIWEKKAPAAEEPPVTVASASVSDGRPAPEHTPPTEETPAPREEVPTPTAEAVAPAALVEELLPRRPSRSRTERLRTADDPLQLGLDALPQEAARPPRAVGHARARRGRGAGAELPSQPTEERPVGRRAREADDELYIDLGYEGELRRTPSGAARADGVHRARQGREPVGTRNTIPPAYAGREYSGALMTRRVEQGYRKALVYAILRLVFAAVGAVAGGIYDILSYVGVEGFTDSVAYPLIGLLLLLLFSAPSLSRMGLGLRSLWDFEPVRYAVPGMALVVTTLHTVILAVAGGENARVLFCGAAMLILTMTCVCDLLSIRSQARSFGILSSGRARVTVTVTDAPGQGRTELCADDMRDEWKRTKEASEGGVTLRVCRTSGIPNFFALVNRYPGRLSHLNYLLPAAMLLAIAAGGTALLTNGGLLTDALPRFTATYLACMPGAFLLSLILPYHVVNRRLSEDGCALLGEATPEQYVPATAGRKTTRILVPDGFALHPICPNEVTRKTDERGDEWVSMAHKLFALLDCPLAGVGEPPRREELADLQIELAERGEEFLRLYLSDRQNGGSVEVHLGTYETLTPRGIRLPDRSLESTYRKTPNAQILYVAFDRHFRLACACEYGIDPLFGRLEEELARLGCRMTILSYDPLVERTPLFAEEEDSARELYRPARYSQLYAARSGGLISVHEGVGVLKAYIACRRISRANAVGQLLGWLWPVILGGLAVASPVLGVPVAALPGLCCAGQLITAAISSLPGLLLTRRRK